MRARGADEETWKFDVVHLKTGRIYQGLLVEDCTFRNFLTVQTP
jgi:hypothetical protein